MVSLRVVAIAGVLLSAGGVVGAGEGPWVLVTDGAALYRISPAGEVAPPVTLGGSVIGMTVVPADATVAQCPPGSVLAVESGARKVWRLDDPLGAATLTEVGRLDGPNVPHSDIAFAFGKLYGLAGERFVELSTQDFSNVGSIIRLSPNGSEAGGLAFDGVDTWYASASGLNQLVTFPHPPQADTWAPVGPAGIGFNNNDLEWHDGVLWGALQRTVNSQRVILVGTFSTATGAFSVLHTLAVADEGAPVGLTLLSVPEEPACGSPDFNADGGVDIFDVQAFFDAFGGTGDGDADFNRDGGVDIFDVDAFFRVFGGGVC